MEVTTEERGASLLLIHETKNGEPFRSVASIHFPSFFPERGRVERWGKGVGIERDKSGGRRGWVGCKE